MMRVWAVIMRPSMRRIDFQFAPKISEFFGEEYLEVEGQPITLSPPAMAAAPGVGPQEGGVFR